MMRRLSLLIASLTVIGSFAFAGGSAAAAFDLFGDPCKNNPEATVCQESKKSQTTSDNSLYGPNGIVGKIINILSFIIGVAAVVVLMIAGIQYMTAAGDPTKVNNAKNAALYAIVGLVVAVLAQVIVRFVIVKLFSA